MSCLLYPSDDTQRSQSSVTHVVNFPLCRLNKRLSYYYFCYNYNYVGKYFFFFYSVAHKLLSICFHIWTHTCSVTHTISRSYTTTLPHMYACADYLLFMAMSEHLRGPQKGQCVRKTQPPRLRFLQNCISSLLGM